jgi:Arc/MetJ family transcription regulator
MNLNIKASTNVEHIKATHTITTFGRVNFEVAKRTREYPLHIVFCIDNSHSMGWAMERNILKQFKNQLTGKNNPAKLAVAKKGLKKSLGLLTANDTYGIVAFCANAKVVQEPRSGDTTQGARSNIHALATDGGTDIRTGLKRSRRLLQKMPSEKAVEWIVLISDGQGTIPTDRELQRQYSDAGITIQAAGVGDDYNRQDLLNVSQQTQGELEHIESGRALKKFFANEVKDARNVVALDAELELTPSSMTTINEVYYSYANQTSTIEPERRGRSVVVDLGDVNYQNPPEVTLEMEVEPGEDDTAMDATLVTATLQTSEEAVNDEMTTAVKPDIGDKLTQLDEEDGETTGDAETSAPARLPEFIEKKVASHLQEGKTNEARRILNDNKEHLPRKKYNELETRIDDVEEGDFSGIGKI